MKTLLRVLSLLAIVAICTSIPASAQTASGKGVSMPFDSRNLGYSTIFFTTNITSSPLTVNITVYNQTGAMVISGFNVQAGSGVSNFVQNPGNASVSFTLAANATADIGFAPSTSPLDTGYATIAWTQNNSTAQYGLIADAKESLSQSWGIAYRTLAVNNNMPF